MPVINNIKFLFINFLICFFPLSLILGNLATNINILLIIVFTLIFFFKNLANFNINYLDKLVFFFFFFTFFFLTINFLENIYFDKKYELKIVEKTFFFIRYLLLYFSIRFLYDVKIFKINYFIIASSAAAFFVCIDIIYQYANGVNFFGIPHGYRHYSGVFGEEWIAGGYLQKFSLFIFFFPALEKFKFSKKIFIQFSLFLFFSAVIILSGNRMPYILFVFSFLIYLTLFTNFKHKIIILFFLFSSVLSFLFLISDNSINKHFKQLYRDGINLAQTVKNYENYYQQPDTVLNKSYVREFFCGRKIASEDFFFGRGIKSYRYNEIGACGNHPHNYYIEIISDLGIFGLAILLLLFFKILLQIKSKYNLKFINNYNQVDYKIIPFLLIIMMEFFPLRTSGSFFTTNNSTLIFLTLPILVSLISKKNI